ncbi:MAG: helix-hairpin-helix domain-containing protein [Candidatus Hydrogenedentes bacterium]|nr:helix-hairpin-helix domain-containing protein [Candidatus Hydrogenedentota bacterium]
MGRSSLLLVGITLICGTLLGWGGASILNRFRDVSVETKASTTETISTDQQQKTSVQSPVTKTPAIQREDILNITPSETHPQNKIVISINGAVRHPGVYTFAEGARVNDGIRKAGGTAIEADIGDINIAARMMDNTSLYIPFQIFRHQKQQTLIAKRTASAAEINPPRYTRSGWALQQPSGFTSESDPSPATTAASVPAEATATPASGLVDLNQATLNELQTLPGVGPKTAEKIDAYRRTQPFRTIEDLESVHGIGPKRMETLRSLIIVN